ncbi:RidA family protein [Pseudomonas sp. NPDC089401]|uniref:RidA family protein n=1 Tax=Pseudomonas sp. NPDC089401 TaxID=3364462 RepID=UPI003817047F
MAIERLHSNKRLSNIVIHNGIVHLAGQLANNHDGDIRTQTRETLANIDALLAQAGSDKSQILSVTIYLKDIQNDFAAMNEIWESWVAEGHSPARACVEAAMFKSTLLVEMAVVAVQS